MADIVHEAQGIKLFGATIPVKVKDDPISKTDQTIEKRVAEKMIPCPRCKSMETKFCYFNNYNVNQPRHFCKACQRYWTAGGALRNVPVGAGLRKAKPQFRRITGGFSESFFFGGSGVEQLLDFDAMVEEWKQLAAAQGEVRRVFPAKRRRSVS